MKKNFFGVEQPSYRELIIGRDAMFCEAKTGRFFLSLQLLKIASACDVVVL